MKTIQEINEKIKKGQAVVLTANEFKSLSDTCTSDELAEKVDVVTTATFGPMCSSGVFLNTGHASPPLKMQKVTVDGVPAYGGIAAADVYLGVTEEHPENSQYGGAHVIRKLIDRESVHFKAEGKSTDCYPGTSAEKDVTLDELNQAYFYNPRNCYQNYNCAVNTSESPLYTYMGKLEPYSGSIHFSGSGDISPLINDPELKTIGLGTKIFFGGGTGYITWEGTQSNQYQEKDPDTGLPVGPGQTLAIAADLREMKGDFVKPIFIKGYGISMSFGIGIPVPVLDSSIAKTLSIKNRDIYTWLVDYSTGKKVAKVDYHSLLEGYISIHGRKIRTRSFSSRKAAIKIVELLKNSILNKEFLLTEPVKQLPIHGTFTSFGSK